MREVATCNDGVLLFLLAMHFKEEKIDTVVRDYHTVMADGLISAVQSRVMIDGTNRIPAQRI